MIYAPQEQRFLPGFFFFFFFFVVDIP